MYYMFSIANHFNQYLYIFMGYRVIFQYLYIIYNDQIRIIKNFPSLTLLCNWSWSSNWSSFILFLFNKCTLGYCELHLFNYIM